MNPSARVPASRRRYDAAAARDEDYGRVLRQAFGDLEAVEARKLHIEQDNVGSEVAGRGQRVGSAARLAHDAIPLRLEQGARSGPETAWSSTTRTERPMRRSWHSYGSSALGLTLRQARTTAARPRA